MYRFSREKRSRKAPGGKKTRAYDRISSTQLAFEQALRCANPWASNLEISEHNSEFLLARRTACTERQSLGRDHWNAWAREMLEIKAMLEDAGRWRVIDRTGYWASRLGEPDLTEGENAETRRWLDLAYSDFRGHRFGPSPILVGFRFPSVADFGALETDQGLQRTCFPDGVNFAGAFFEDHALFSHTLFGGGGPNFIGAQFGREAFFLGAAFDGEIEFNHAKFVGLATFDSAEFHQAALMANAIFMEGPSFLDTVFHDIASFEDVQFNGDAFFENAKFKDFAIFKGAQFLARAFFYSADFAVGGSFVSTHFAGDVYFSPPPEEIRESKPCRFPGMMSFRRATFERAVTFENATFAYESDFVAIQVKSLFTVAGATFIGIPDFSQADFKQAPLFDQTLFLQGIRMPTRNTPFDSLSRSRTGGDERADLPARYRALKRLAIQSHDFGRELDFHAEELKARRGFVDLPFGRGMGSYWFGLLYQISSNFGRSLARPLVCWLTVTVFSAGIYSAAQLIQPKDCSPAESAVYIAVRKGLTIVSVGTETAEKLKHAYECLYGHEAPPAGGAITATVVPYVVEVVSFTQTVISGVLLFLFGLTLRNRFRIR